MSFLEVLLSFWKKKSADQPVISRPKIFDQVEVAFWKSNTYRAENGDLGDITPLAVEVISYWELKRGNMIELNITFPASFPSESHSIRVHAIVKHCHRPRGRKRFRIDCQFQDIDISAAQKIQEFREWALQQT